MEEVRPLYELLRTSVPATVRLFLDLSAARAWLELSEEGERRRDPRKTVRLNVQMRKGIQEFSGRLMNISLSGALLQCASFRLLKGNFVKIHFQPDWSSPVELTGTVVRHADSTFAIQFLSVTDELVDLLTMNHRPETPSHQVHHCLANLRPDPARVPIGRADLRRAPNLARESCQTARDSRREHDSRGSSPTREEHVCELDEEVRNG